LEQVLEGPRIDVAFFEVSPENYMRRGGYYPAVLEALKERYVFLTHGLTLSLGAVDPPSPSYLAELEAEVARLGSPWHSDHLCTSSAGPLMLHELLPLKHSRESVTRVADRLRAAEDQLGVPMAVENISYYAHPGLHAAYGDRAHPTPLRARLHEAGRHGQKAGRGFYDYPPGATAGVPSPEVDALLGVVRAELGALPRPRDTAAPARNRW
jgi:uncharacterized protein (UPF0276 family)